MKSEKCHCEESRYYRDDEAISKKGIATPSARNDRIEEHCVT
ncbi:MAG: hypothetical protein AAB017_09375 [Nitrospirota bacterium]